MQCLKNAWACYIFLRVFMDKNRMVCLMCFESSGHIHNFSKLINENCGGDFTAWSATFLTATCLCSPVKARRDANPRIWLIFVAYSVGLKYDQ
jgi:hypothetical protein